MIRSASKGLQDFENSFFVTRQPESRPERNGLHFLAGPLDVVVDDRVIVAAIVHHFLPCAFEPPANFVFRILPTLPDAMLEFRPRRRQHKNCHGARQFGFYLQSSLHVNFENQVFFLRFRFSQTFAGSAVPVLPEHLRVFQEISALHHFLKLRLGDKIVPLAVALRLARHPRGARNRQHGAGQLQNLFHQGGLPRARGSGDDEHQRVRFAHSMFCTCSRNFSISDLISSASRVISRPSRSFPGVFESRVLASRCISCSRKSSFLPASEALASKSSNCCTWLRRRTNSSETSLRSAANAASCANRVGAICVSPRRSFRRVSRRLANAGRARSANVLTFEAKAAMVRSLADISPHKRPASSPRIWSSLSSDSTIQRPSTDSRRSSSFSRDAAAAPITPGKRIMDSTSGSDCM